MADPETKRDLKRRDFLKLGAAAGVVGLLQAQGDAAQQPTTATTPSTPVRPSTTVPGVRRGGTFTMARPNSMQDFSGVWFTRGNTPFIPALYNTLLRLDKDFNPQPELAESWQFSADGHVLSMKLRQGVKFHTGREFTAQDVKFSWSFGTEERGGFGSQMRQMFRLITDVKTPDKYTVDLMFERPTPLVFDVLDTLAMFDQSVANKINTTDAGSGPFMVASYTPNADVRMKRFDGYWEPGKPYLDEYIVRTIPDTTALAVNLESKAVDAIDGASLYDAVRLKAQPGIVCEVAAKQNVFHLAANVRRQPLSDRRVRQAINYAIDRERCCKTVLQGTVEPTCLHWPRESWAHFRDLEGRYSQNLEKAKALLAEAGYSNGFETSILVSKQYNDSLFGIGQIIQSDLAKIGIKAQLKNVEATVYLTTWRKAEWDLAVHNYGRANRDPGTMLSGAVAFYTRAENGPPGFESAEFEKWRGEAASILDREKRKALYRKIQEFFLEDSFSMPIAADQTLWLYRDHIHGLSFTREACPFASEVWLGG